jgi:hypothetical protein
MIFPYSERSVDVIGILCVSYLLFRLTIAQAKEISCFTPGREENARKSGRNNGNASSFARNTCLLQKEDSSSEPLFERGHFLARQQLSNESATSTRRLEDTVSVAKSNL